MDRLTPLITRRGVMTTPCFYVRIFFGISLVTIAMFWVYEPAADLHLTVKFVRPQNMSRPATPSNLRPLETFPHQPMLKRKVHFNMTNIWKVREITRKYFDPKKHIIYFSDFDIFMEKCDYQTFTLRDSPERPCNVVHTPIKHYRTCAVVGNGGILLESNCGAEIDSHDFVIRLNQPPIHDYRRDVGSRTNLTIVNGKLLKEISRTLQSVYGKTLKTATSHNDVQLFESPGMIFSYPFIFTKKRQAEMRVIDTAIKNYNKTTITAFPSTSFLDSKRVYEELVGKHWNFTSTGLNSFALASTFCDKISMYGFYPMPLYQSRRFPYHYYDKRLPSGSHDFDGEFAMLQQLNVDGVIRHVLGECKPATDA
ncbi:alpha-2,8-sialyltransferase 8B-like [Branchiostoma lanceolatum]|uniref:alpha-2,8-sialyltransferase 8B-like n=1 Tax=Branchiostoma lanceolatum TaxID=7740 RepID=UPI003454E4E4